MISGIQKGGKHLRALADDPKFYQLVGPGFWQRPQESRKSLYRDFPELAELGISLEFVERLSRGFYRIEPENIRALLSKIAKWAVAEQRDGAWSILTKEQLKHMNPGREDAIEGYGKAMLPNPWTNALLTLFLIKWYAYLTRFPYTLAHDNDLQQIEEVVSRSKKWLISNTTVEGEFEGWARLIPAIGDKINIYDTGFVYLTLIYSTGFADFQPTQPFSPQQATDTVSTKNSKILATLTGNEFRKEGGWAENLGNTKPETGATSYALLALLKYWEVENDAGYADIVREGIEWLVRNQLDDGGWSKSDKNSGELFSIEKTCYAMMALLKYCEIVGDVRVDPSIHRGLSALKRSFTRVQEDPIVYCWQSDREEYEENTCIKNSSLAISTLIRCGISIYDETIQKGLLGLFQLVVEDRHDFNIDHLVKVYFCCALLDYLKAAR